MTLEATALQAFRQLQAKHAELGPVARLREIVAARRARLGLAHGPVPVVFDQQGRPKVGSMAERILGPWPSQAWDEAQRLQLLSRERWHQGPTRTTSSWQFPVAQAEDFTRAAAAAAASSSRPPAPADVRAAGVRVGGSEETRAHRAAILVRAHGAASTQEPLRARRLHADQHPATSRRGGAPQAIGAVLSGCGLTAPVVPVVPVIHPDVLAEDDREREAIQAECSAAVRT